MSAKTARTALCACVAQANSGNQRNNFKQPTGHRVPVRHIIRSVDHDQSCAHVPKVSRRDFFRDTYSIIYLGLLGTHDSGPLERAGRVIRKSLDRVGALGADASAQVRVPH